MLGDIPRLPPAASDHDLPLADLCRSLSASNSTSAGSISTPSPGASPSRAHLACSSRSPSIGSMLQ